MNLTLHIIRKDLRALRWLMLLWVVACLTHLGLRLAQNARGDAAPLTPFWRNIETTHRFDFNVVCILPILIIPLLLHLDPLRGALSFWKTVPISRARLLTAKGFTLVAFFIALPFLCEVVYFLKAGLSVVLATALADWAWRFLPGIAAVVLGCAFTRSLKVGVPCVVFGVWLAAIIFHYPYGRDRIGEPFMTAWPKEPGVIAAPAGSRFEITPKSTRFAPTNQTINEPGKPPRQEERLAIALTVGASGLPSDVIVKGVFTKIDRIHLPGRTVMGSESDGASTGSRGYYHGELPAQEMRNDIGRYDSSDDDIAPDEWRGGSGYFRIATKDLPPAGALVEGTVRVELVRRHPVATLPLESGAQWRPGLHRLTLNLMGPPDSQLVNFVANLAAVTADPRGDTGGLAITPQTRFDVWIEHNTLPFRKHAQAISSSAWRSQYNTSGRPRDASTMNLRGGWSGNWGDITRERKRTEFSTLFDPVQALRNRATPLALARFAEEQAQVRNWHLALYTYENLGSVEIPLKAVVPRPQVAREEQDDELKPPRPSLGVTLAEVNVPANPSRADAERIIAQLAEVTKASGEDSIRRHEKLLFEKLTAFGPDNIEVLLAAATAANPRADVPEIFGRNDMKWLVEKNHWRRILGGFWHRVIIVACDMARPSDKATILRFHSPVVNLLRAIEPNGWTADALPAMCATAASEPLPDDWNEVLASNPSPQTRAALFAQIRLRAVAPEQVADLIQRGALPAREAASALWETVVAKTSRFPNLTPTFPLAVKHGVEIIPRDLLRILRMKMSDLERSNFMPSTTILSAFVQSFSLRSDCPPTVAEAGPWLEQNALALQFNDATGRYELPGSTKTAPDFTKWGTLTDPLGAGRAQLDGDALVLTSAGFHADYTHDPALRFAPRVMREIEGDFTVEVTMQPAFMLAQSWTRNENAIFESAGLLLEGGPFRSIRFEQAVWKNAAGNELREETVRGGRGSVMQRGTKEWDPAKPVHLRMTRRGDLFATAWQQDGGVWFESAALREHGWPRKVRIGVLVVNQVTRPFGARFSDLKIEHSSQLADLSFDPHPGGEPTPSGTKLGEFGIVENPVAAGIFRSEGNELSIDVAPTAADYHIQQRMTAPRAMTEVEGDFTFEATVRPTPRKDWSSGELLLASGFDFYFRTGLASLRDRPHFTYDYAERGALSGVVNLDAARDPSKPIRIRLQRRGRFVTVSHQQDGGAWVEFYPLDFQHWPAKIQVGVVALNTSRERFTAEFTDVSLTRDAK